MYEKIYNHRYCIIVVVIIACITACYMFGRGTSGNNNDVQGTVQRIADDNKRAGTALDGVRDELTAAGAELTGADRYAERAEGIARQNTETIRSCREILERSKIAHRRAEQLLADVERANKERTEEK